MQKALLISAIISLALFSSCKKFIEKQKEKTVVEAMTDGRWIVYQYRTPTSDVTSEFAGYEFQFFSNGTVQGIYGTTLTNGTWSGDMNALTILANFPSATPPVNRLNALWKITESSWYDVTAYSYNGPDTNWLKLEKK